MSVYLAPGLIAHIRRSVVDGVEGRELRIRDPVLSGLIRQHYGAAPFKLWGVKDTLKGPWSRARPNDWLLFYHAGKLAFGGKVAFLYPREERVEQVEEGMRLAEQVWGRDPRDGKTWPYLFFLTDVRELMLPLAQLNEVTGYAFRSIGGFMRVAKDRSAKLLPSLEELTRVPGRHPIQLTPHEMTVQQIYELGEFVGYKPQKKWRRENYEYDVVWHRPPREGPKCVFEVHVKGELGEALLRLKHAHDRWESHLFLVSTKEQIELAKAKYLVGSLHELAEEGALTLIDVREMEDFYRFKGRFEWLERRFGLRPR